ncbi:MAG: tRNA lysidine(34) synthetase TilS, partial [Clostridiales bacterium]
YAEVNNLEFRQDMSNFSTKYLRNQIRLQLLPQLTAYNPRIVDALTTTADICGQEDHLLDDMAENSLAELWLVEENALNGPGFDRLPLALKRRVLRKAFCLFAGEKPELSFGQAQAIITLKDEQSTALVQGKLAYRRGHIYFDRSMPPAAIYGERIKPLRDAQWHKLAQWGWCYRISSVRRYNTIADDTIVIPASFYDKLTFRTRRDGDSVYSSGKMGKKKLKDLFIEEKLPKYVKNTWPLLLLDEEIIWVPYLYRREFKDEGEAILIKISKDDII